VKPGDTLHIKREQLPSQAFWWQQLYHALSHQRLVVEFDLDSRMSIVVGIEVQVESQTVVVDITVVVGIDVVT
jgi:hypothetical protein